MTIRNRSSWVSLTTLAAVCGVLAGVGGFTHAIGEIVQGSEPTGALVFDSWASGRIAANLGGEPAMSLAPNLFVSGILTGVASVAVAGWAAIYVGRRHGGVVLIALSVVMLLVGGGFGPPLLGILAGVVAAAAHTRRAGPLTPRRTGRLLAAGWPALFWLAALNAAFLVVGSLVVAVVADLAMPGLFVASLFLAVLGLPLAALAGTADQARRRRSGCDESTPFTDAKREAANPGSG
jgi:hypothetical protein